MPIKASPFLARRKEFITDSSYFPPPPDNLPSADLIRVSTVKEKPHRYGCLMAVIPQPISQQIIDWGNEVVSDQDLALEGREDQIHVTIKYGFRDSSQGTLDALKGMLVAIQPFTIRLTGLSLFTGGEYGDVLKADVYSPALHDLNKLITQKFDCENKYPKYIPHVTIAYLNCADPGKYTRQPTIFVGRDILISNVEWSDSEKNRTTLPLGKGSKTLSSLSEASGGALVRPARQRKKLLVPKLKTLYGIKEITQKKDKLGRNRCYDTTAKKPVKCGGNATSVDKPKPKPKKEVQPKAKPKKVTLDEARERNKRLHEGGLTAQKLSEIADTLASLTVKDLQVLRKEMNLKSSPKKADLVKVIRDFVGMPPEVEKPLEPKIEPKPTESEVQIDYMQNNPDDAIAKEIRNDTASAAIVKNMLSTIKSITTDPKYQNAVKSIAEESKLWEMLELAKKKYGELSPECNKVREKWLELYQKNNKNNFKELVENGREAIRAEFVKAMKPTNPIQITKKYGEESYLDKASDKILKKVFSPSEMQEKDIDGGLAFITSITEGSSVNMDVKFRNSLDGRASFNEQRESVKQKNRWLKLMGIQDEKIDPVIQLGLDYKGRTNDDIATVSHELGHFLEEVKPGVKERIKKFMDYRIGKEQPVDMGTIPGGSAMKGEMVRKDKFERAFSLTSAYYVGKQYKNAKGEIYGTEILSMGIEKLYSDPATFFEKDPEYAQFIVSLLRMP